MSFSAVVSRCLALAVFLLVLGACHGKAPAGAAQLTQQEVRLYEREETRALVALVNDAADLLHTKGESAFADFREPRSRWRQHETYIFVLDPQGNMIVHPDPTMEGKNELDLKDVNGKLVIRGLINTATSLPGKTDGWYHYEWPVPGGLLPRWKSTYVHLVKAPSGKDYVVASGMYDDRMERAFVVDLVRDAVQQIEKNGTSAFPLFRDKAGRYIAKDAYIFVMDSNGVELVNGAFPNLEGRNLSNVKDAQGKLPIQEMLRVVQSRDSGWVDYMWPKPGESVSTQKSAFVQKAALGKGSVIVGCGVYLPRAPTAAPVAGKMTAPELMGLVREAASVLERRGEKAYPEFRTKGSKWFRDDTYFFVWTMDGTRAFHAANPALEGTNGREEKDIVGRPYGKTILERASIPAGEGWVHYMYPEPGSLFPTWKSAFVKRVTFPSGEARVIGAGVYDMKMDREFIKDLVNRAAALVAERGRDAFSVLRDKKGPYVFMDTYVFVLSPDGNELVDAAHPSLEGRNLMGLKDLTGKAVVPEEIAAASKEGSAWLECYWFKPGENTPARKQTYVRKVQAGRETFIVGSGIYLE